MASDYTPWDVYIDEHKMPDQFALGYLVVPNTSSFLHKLYRCRQVVVAPQRGSFVWDEIHWNEPSLKTLGVALKWIDCVFDHRGTRFFLHRWETSETKELAILKFLERLCRVKKLSKPFNVVAFLNFDSDHAKHHIQNRIRKIGRIARCYHLHSDNNDCLQCCDLLMGANLPV